MPIRTLAFGLGAILIPVGPFLVYWWTHVTALAWLALVAAAAFTFVTRIDDLISELSLGPLKAKMRETIDEAAVTIEQLREVATATARVVLTDLMAGNFLDSMNMRKRLELHDEIMATLDKIGVSEAQKAAAEAEWRKGIGLTYHRAIGKAIAEDQTLDPKERQKIGREFQQTMEYDEWRVFTPEDMERFFAERECWPARVKDWIDDYRYYLQYNQVRNREAFAEQ